jgi:hypothetical protein
MWTHENLYQYSEPTLRSTYAVAIGISTLSVLMGTYVVLTTQASYKSSFSTFLRLSHNMYLSGGVRLEDTSGRDPLPRHLSNAVLGFPPENTLASEWKEVNSLNNNHIETDGTYTGLTQYEMHDDMKRIV